MFSLLIILFARRTRQGYVEIGCRGRGRVGSEDINATGVLNGSEATGSPSHEKRKFDIGRPAPVL